jgi:hypothetical protein
MVVHFYDGRSKIKEKGVYPLPRAICGFKYDYITGISGKIKMTRDREKVTCEKCIQILSRRS